MFISQISQLKPSFRALFNQAELLLANGKKIFCSNNQVSRTMHFFERRGLKTHGSYTKSLLTGTTSSRTSAFAGFGMMKDLENGGICSG